MKYLSISVIVFIVSAVIALVVVGERKMTEHNNACIAKGGVPFRSRDAGFICLKPEALINP